ncbi:MAG TPA: hypothetical protein VGM06_16170 [Polyangiaceae bacterium]
MRAILGPAVLAMLACTPSSSSGVAHAPAPPASRVEADRARTAAFSRVEDEALDWLVASDPRMAQRADTTATDAVIKRIGLEAVLAEDTTAQIRGSSLDLFAFRGRARALAHAAQALAEFKDPLPDVGPLGSGLARPRLERELLGRVIAEESARAEEEAALGEVAGELVRGITSTWTRPAAPQEWTERDDWVSKHLLEIRESLRDGRPLTGPSDLDSALYPLERLLEPAQFPRGSAAIAEVRLALDDDRRSVPKVDAPTRLARDVRVHLGVSVDPPTLVTRLDGIEARLRELAEQAVPVAGIPAAEVASRARRLLLVERPCSPVADSRVRSLGPPDERAAICGALKVLSEESPVAVALVALHDDVLLSYAAVVPAPRRANLMSHPEDADVDSLQRGVRERPVKALGVALAAELLYRDRASPDVVEARMRAWRALGEAPLDVVARELQRP